MGRDLSQDKISYVSRHYSGICLTTNTARQEILSPYQHLNQVSIPDSRDETSENKNI
jgi:hypothetical protein